MVDPNTADIRGYLMSAYGDEDLTTLCSDYFRDVYENFTAGMTKGQKIQLLLDRCQRRETFPELLAALERDRPAQYRRRFGAAIAETRPEPTQPVRDVRQVFISHAHEDTEFAHRLAADLQQNGWRVWIALDNIRPGEKWVEAIERGLEESGVFVVLLTSTAVKSRWVKTETNLAIELEHQEILQFVPAEIEACRVPLMWSAYQRIAFTGRYGDGLAKLLKVLQKPIGSAQRAEENPSPSVPAKDKAVQQPTRPGRSGETDERSAPAAVRSQADIPEAKASKSLRVNLTHSDPATRAEAARALGRLAAADAGTVSALLRLYPADPADAPRHAALEALLALGRHADVGMVLVPVGEFLMGSAGDDRDAEDREKPQHRVYLPAYYLDGTPVTNAQYRRFIEAGGYANPAYWKEARAANRWKGGAYTDYDDKPRAQPIFWTDAKWNGDQQPVVGVT